MGAKLKFRGYHPKPSASVVHTSVRYSIRSDAITSPIDRANPAQATIL